MEVVARLKDGDLMITGEISERLPAITNGLIAHYPFDNSINQDNLLDDTREKTGSHPSGEILWELSRKVYAGQVYTVSGYFKRDSVHDGTIYCMFDLRRKDGTIATGADIISGWASNDQSNEPLYCYFHDDIKNAVDDYVYWERDIVIPSDFDEGEFKWIRFSWADAITKTGTTSMIRPCLALKGHNVYTPILNQHTTLTLDGIIVEDGTIELPMNINPKSQSFSVNYWIKMNGDDDTGMYHTDKSIFLNNFGSIWRRHPVSTTSNVKLVWDYVASTRVYSDQTSDTLFVEGIYEMITLTWDKSSVNIYRNGVLWGNAPSTNDCTLGVIDKIGMYNVQDTVKNLSIYNRTLSADEVKTLSTGRMSLNKNGNVITLKLVEDSQLPNVQMRDKDGLQIQGQLKEGVIL